MGEKIPIENLLCIAVVPSFTDRLIRMVIYDYIIYFDVLRLFPDIRSVSPNFTDLPRTKKVIFLCNLTFFCVCGYNICLAIQTEVL